MGLEPTPSAVQRQARWLTGVVDGSQTRISKPIPPSAYSDERLRSPFTGVKIPAERSGCYRVEGDFVAQPFQTPHKTTLDELTIPLIEVIAT
jgi:hypothetical protein